MGEGGIPDSGSAPLRSVLERRQQRMRRRDGTRAAIDAGNGSPEAYEAIRIAEEGVAAPLTERERDHIRLEVADAAANRAAYVVGLTLEGPHSAEAISLCVMPIRAKLGRGVVLEPQPSKEHRYTTVIVGSHAMQPSPRAA